MGLFSKNCVCCHHSVLGPYALHKPDPADHPENDGYVEHDNSWMNDVVVIAPEGVVISGQYDGYGRVYDPRSGAEINLVNTGYEMGIGGKPCKFVHHACWKAMGKPSYDDLGPDEPSKDQGHFIKSTDYDHARPETPEDVEAIGRRPAPSMW